MPLGCASGARGGRALVSLVALLASAAAGAQGKGGGRGRGRGFYEGYSPVQCERPRRNKIKCTSAGLGEGAGEGTTGFVPDPGDLSDDRQCALASENCKQVKCCHAPGYVCFEKNEFWAGCRLSCTVGPQPDDPWDYGTGPWTCNVLGDWGPPPGSSTTHPPAGGGEPPAGGAPYPPHDSPVAKHGSLSVKGSAVVDRFGNPVQLAGMSLFWSQWAAHYWNADVVKWLVNDWGVSLLRAAMAVEHGGHLVNPAAEELKVRTVVRAAIEAGIYVIIDWHDHNAELHRGQAQQFFDQMAREFGHVPNVLFETFNEPVYQDWARDIKPYHEAVAGTIRSHSSNLIICGTRHWSQDVDEAARNPVSHHTNIAYTLHYYASTHGEELRDKGRLAMSRGVPIFITEWGTCSADGNGALNLEEARSWLGFAHHHKISHANWAVNDKDESCSALRPGAAWGGAWPQSMLTESGAFIRNQLRGLKGEPEPCAPASVDCRAAGCCSNPAETCYEKDAHWASCMESCVPGAHSADPPEYRTPWSCREIGRHTCAQKDDNCREFGCCVDEGHTCYEKHAHWAGCRISCEPGLHAEDPLEHRTPWTCNAVLLFSALNITLPLASPSPADLGATGRRSAAPVAISAVGGLAALLFAVARVRARRRHAPRYVAAHGGGVGEHTEGLMPEIE